MGKTKKIATIFLSVYLVVSGTIDLFIPHVRTKAWYAVVSLAVIWLIEFSQEPASLDEFASLLDQKLQEINSDYEAKRFHDVTLQHLEIVKAKPGLFNEWLKSKGKLGGQHKIPRLSNSRKNIDEMLMMNK